MFHSKGVFYRFVKLYDLVKPKSINSKKDKYTNMDKKDKVKVEFDRDVLNHLIKLKEVGDTYSDVVRRLLEKCK